MTRPAARRRPIAILVHSYYEEDPRVRRQAESLVAAGHRVDVFALRRPDDPPTGELDGVSLTRLDVQRHQGAGLATYLAEYIGFFVRVTIALLRAHRRRRYAVVQVATLPDWLVFAALPLRLVGVPVLLDLHEAMPEFFRSRFPASSNVVVRTVLRLQERASIAAATHVLTVNDALRDRLLRAGVDSDRISVVINSPSLARFDRAAVPPRPFMADGTLRIVYAGALTPTYELDVAMAGIARLADLRPDLPIDVAVYGRGDSEDALAKLVATLDLGDRVTFHGRIPIEAVPRAIAAADIGLAPTRHDDFTDMSLSTKIFEYAAMGKPVVCSRLPMVERTFEPGAVWTYVPGDAASLADAILAIVDDPAGRLVGTVVAAARTLALAWEREGERYIALVEGLARPD